MRRQRTIVKRIGLLLGISLFLAASGCGESLWFDEQKASREDARRARENRAMRQAAHAEAMQIQAEIRPRLVLGASSLAFCERRVIQPRRPFRGMLPVACGNFGASWPLSVDFGFLRCELSVTPVRTDRRVIFTTQLGVDYAISESARWVGYPRIAPIFAERGSQPRYHTVLTRVGSRLCQKEQ